MPEMAQNRSFDTGAGYQTWETQLREAVGCQQRVPAPMLLARDLSPHAKLIFMVRAAFPDEARRGTTALARLCAISRPGVRNALSEPACSTVCSN